MLCYFLLDNDNSNRSQRNRKSPPPRSKTLRNNQINFANMFSIKFFLNIFFLMDAPDDFFSINSILNFVSIIIV